MDPLITLIVSICMSLMFGMAAVHKLKAFAIFRATMDEYQLVPRQISGPGAVLLVATELLAALMVLVPATRPTGAGSK